MQRLKGSWSALLTGVSLLAVDVGLPATMMVAIDSLPVSAQITTIGASDSDLGVTSALGVSILSSASSGVTVTNNGQIAPYGVRVSGSVVRLTNHGTISGFGSISGVGSISTIAVDNLGTIGTLISSAANTTLTTVPTIVGTTGIYNESGANIGTLINDGVIYGTADLGAGLNNAGTIGAINNIGVITYLPSTATFTGNALKNAHGASIGTLTNTGTITSGSGDGIGNSGIISAIVTSGTISGSHNAIENYGTGSIGLLTNSGVIAGNIASATDLAIAGGSGQQGTLTGYAAGTQGTITAPNLFFSSGSLLLDDLIVAGSGSGLVSNSASLQVNRLVTITGNYVQTSSGKLVVGVSSVSSYGQLQISGTADLAGTVTIVGISAGALATGEKLTIVTSGALTNSGAVVDVGGYGETVETTGANLVVTVGATNGISSWQDRVAAAGAPSSLAPALETLATNSNYVGVLTALAALPSDDQGHALQQLSNTPSGAAAVASGVNIFPVTAAVETHQFAMLPGIQVGKAAGSEARSKALWGQVLGGHASLDAGSGASGYSADSIGLLVGADFAITDSVVAGAALDWLRSDSEGSGTGSGTSTVLDTYQLTLHGGWRPDGGPLSLLGLVAAGLNHYDSDRWIDFLGENASASYYGRQFQARLTAGYDLMPAPGWTFTPLTSLQYVRVANSAYTEDGSIMGQSVDSYGFDSVESELGGRVSTGFETPFGRANVDFKAAWVHSFTNSPIAVSTAIGGAGFVSTTDRPDADGARLALGATVGNDEGLSLRLEYDADLSANYQSHTGLFRLRQEF